MNQSGPQGMWDEEDGFFYDGPTVAARAMRRLSFTGARYTTAPAWSNRPRRELVDEDPAVEDSAYPLGLPAPDGEAADGRHASDHGRSPIYRAAAPRCLSKKALISPKASFVSGA